MKKRMVVLPTFMIVFFSLATGIRAQDFVKKFSLKFNGGLSTVAIGDYNTFIDAQDSYFNTYMDGPKFTAIPANLSLYYFYPVASSMNLFLNAGVGYYFGKATSSSRLDYELIGEPSEWAKSEGEFKDQGLGFHGGIGLEFMIGTNIGLYVEGKGRYCKLKSWEGDSTNTDSNGFTEKNSGTLWLVEELDPDIDVWFCQISKQ